MIDRSNPITDILVKAITDFVIVESKGTADTENVKARIETAAQALYEAVKAVTPKAITPETVQLIPPGHSRDYVLYCEGFNNCRREVLTNLSELFEVKT